MREAARRRARLVIAPEAILDGYVAGADADTTRERMLSVAQTVPEGSYIVRWGKLARELGIFLIFVLLSLAILGLWPPLAFGLAGLTLWAYTTWMPQHRGSIHTIRAGLLFGAIAAAALYPILYDFTLRLWSGLCLAFGHLAHLWKDR